MQGIAEPAGIVKQAGPGGSDRADHIEICVNEPRGGQGLKKRDRKDRGQNHKA